MRWHAPPHEFHFTNLTPTIDKEPLFLCTADGNTYTIRYPAADTGRAAITSTAECCFTNIVETDISTAATTDDIFIHFELISRQSHNAIAAPIEPITCMEGHTFVFVSSV